MSFVESSKKRLYIAANTRFPNEKAHTNQIVKNADALSALGWSVTVVIPRRVGNQLEEVVGYYALSRPLHFVELPIVDFLSIQFLHPRIGFSLNRFQFLLCSLIYLFFHKGIVLTRSLELAAALSVFRKMIFFDAHSYPGHFQSLCLKKCHGLICNSQGTADAFIGIGLKSIMVAPNAYDESLFDGVSPNYASFEKLSNRSGRSRVLYSGQLLAWKGIATVLEVAALLPDHDFFFLGGAERDIAAWQSEAMENNLENVFFFGQVPPSLVAPYLLAADVCLVPNSAKYEESVHFTSPLKLFECLASGRPLVVSDLPSMRSLSLVGVEYFQADNASDLKMAIERALQNDTEERRRLALGYVKKFTLSNRAEKISAFLLA